MKRILALAVIVLAVGAVAGTALADRGKGHGKKHHGRVIHVIEHATTDAVSNSGNAGGADNVGDILTFANPVFDVHDASQVGSDQGYCVRLVIGESWECNWTTLLAKGQLTVEGPFYDTRDSVLAITGGTGSYANARGFMELRSRAGGTEFDFIFHLIG